MLTDGVHGVEIGISVRELALRMRRGGGIVLLNGGGSSIGEIESSPPGSSATLVGDWMTSVAACVGDSMAFFGKSVQATTPGLGPGLAKPAAQRAFQVAGWRLPSTITHNPSRLTRRHGGRLGDRSLALALQSGQYLKELI